MTALSLVTFKSIDEIGDEHADGHELGCGIVPSPALLDLAPMDLGLLMGLITAEVTVNEEQSEEGLDIKEELIKLQGPPHAHVLPHLLTLSLWSWWWSSGRDGRD